MAKRIKKVLMIILVIAIAVLIFAYVWYFFRNRGAFEVTIEDKSKMNVEHPNFPPNIFEAGQTIELNVFVSCNDTSEHIRLIASDGSVPINLTSQSDNIGDDGITYSFNPSQGSGQIGFGSILTVTTPTTAPQGYYTITVIGIDDSGVTHSDAYSFNLVS